MFFSFKLQRLPKWIQMVQYHGLTFMRPIEFPVFCHINSWSRWSAIDVAMIIDYWCGNVIKFPLFLIIHMMAIAIYCHGHQPWKSIPWLSRVFSFEALLHSGAPLGFVRWCHRNPWVDHQFPMTGWWWLEPWNFDWLSICWEWNNDPNWQTPSFFRGVGIPPSRLPVGMADIDAGGQAYWEMLRDEHPFGQ